MLIDIVKFVLMRAGFVGLFALILGVAVGLRRIARDSQWKRILVYAVSTVLLIIAAPLALAIFACAMREILGVGALLGCGPARI